MQSGDAPMQPGRVRTTGLRIGELAGWLIVAGIGAIMLTQAFGWNGTQWVATLQSLTPYAIVALLPIAGVASWQRRHALAVVTSVVGVSVLLLASPLVFTPSQPPPMDDATGLRVASVNLYYENPTVGRAADMLLSVDADVIVFVEYTAEHQQVLLDSALAANFPHRIDRDGLNAGGTAIWSRFPLVAADPPATVNYSLDVTVAAPDGDVRVLGIHPPTPVFDFEGWKHDLRVIGELLAQPGGPTLVVGDFNASYWHPPFRDLLTGGFVDAHMAAGRGFAASWPADRAFPPFVQLDHALTGHGLVSTDVADFSVPGSDHRGFVVTVVPAR
jgi:endonuclease/exonuclease/phosphatase (EEP) superfamily protein YafD